MDVGQDIKTERANWSFGDKVADRFAEHVRRSVPWYEEGHALICQLSDFFCLDNSICYELGVSAGELIKKLALHNRRKPDIRWIGLDIEPAMIKTAENHCKDVANIELLCADIRLVDFEKSDLIVSYYCIQFIPARYRQELFNKIYAALNWSGAFLLFEKVRAPDARFQDIQVALYNEFKLRNGFSAEEVLNKSLSLKGVLEPFSTEGNLGLLRRAGFTDIMTVMKNIGFEGFLAIK
ncbi:MAG: methyltransferase domain-containing protein [Methylococcaceae bacterium]|nr:methyltransferase domain-containing protein [Methylococcaceae bacterium]MCI0734243.1 methyltransferase domain-containing protein [Methylococcaceae bacterium]